MAFTPRTAVISSDSSGVGASTQATAAYALTAGDFQYVTVKWEALNGTCAVTDTAGNTYVALPAARDTTRGQYVQLFYCPVSIGSATNVVTATFSAATATFRNVVVRPFAVSGYRPTLVTAPDPVVGGSSTLPLTGPFRPGNLAVAVLTNFSGLALTSANAGWAIVSDTGVANGHSTLDRNDVPTAQITAGATISGAAFWAIASASFTDQVSPGVFNKKPRRRRQSHFDWSGGGLFDSKSSPEGWFSERLLPLVSAPSGATAGASQAASQAAGGQTTVVVGPAQAASQATGGATLSVKGEAQSLSQTAGLPAAGSTITAAGAAQAASQAVGSVVFVVRAEAQAASQAVGGTVAVVRGEAQSAGQAAGLPAAGSTVTAAGVAQAASQSVGGAVVVASGVAQSATQAAGGSIRATAGEAQSLSQAVGVASTGTTLVVAGVASAASQAFAAPVQTVAGSSQSVGQAAAAQVGTTGGAAQAASQAQAGAVATVGGQAQQAAQAEGQGATSAAGVGSGVSAGASQAAGLGISEGSPIPPLPGGGYDDDKRKKRRLLVEIDGKTYEVTEKQLRELERQWAQEAADKAVAESRAATTPVKAIKPKPPRITGVPDNVKEKADQAFRMAYAEAVRKAAEQDEEDLVILLMNL